MKGPGIGSMLHRNNPDGSFDMIVDAGRVVFRIDADYEHLTWDSDATFTQDAGGNFLVSATWTSGYCVIQPDTRLTHGATGRKFDVYRLLLTHLERLADGSTDMRHDLADYQV